VLLGGPDDLLQECDLGFGSGRHLRRSV
jgi:hypothetical protein